MTLTVTRCPLCLEELDRWPTNDELHRLGEVDPDRYAKVGTPEYEPFGDLVSRLASAAMYERARVLEERCVSHFESRHPFRYWLHRRGLRSIRG